MDGFIIVSLLVSVNFLAGSRSSSATSILLRIVNLYGRQLTIDIIKTLQIDVLFRSYRAIKKPFSESLKPSIFN